MNNYTPPAWVSLHLAIWLALAALVILAAAFNLERVQAWIRRQFVNTGQRVRDHADTHQCRCRECGSPLEADGTCTPCREWDAIVNDDTQAVIHPTAIVNLPDVNVDPVGHFQAKAWLAVGELPQAGADPFDDLSNRVHHAFDRLQADLDRATRHALALCGAT